MEAQRFLKTTMDSGGSTGQLLYASAGKALADAQATTLDPASYIPSSKLPAIAGAVNAAATRKTE